MYKKKCPTCNKKCYDLECYCTKCGVVLVKNDNVCSENKTQMFSKRIYHEDDIYCAYCGSMTMYALDSKRAMQQ